MISDLAQRQIKSIGETWKKGNKAALVSLLEEIDEQGYTTVSQVKGAIHADLTILEGLGDE